MKKKELVFYVSPQGNDAWSGRKPVPSRDGRDGPWTTPAHARDAIRAVRARRGGQQLPVRVWMRGGRYELADTLSFGAEDAGLKTAPVVWAAYPGEAAVLSGGRRITDWQRGEVHGLPCWQATLPDVAKGQWAFTQLFVNGQRAARTRRPREGYFRFTGLPEGTHGLFHGVKSAQYAEGEIQDHWKNLSDVKIVALQHWFESHLHLERIDPAQRIVHFEATTLSDLFDETGRYARYYIENVFEDLAEPGQWYLDRPAGVLYYLPRAGETPELAEVIAPCLEVLLHLEHGADHLHFENLAFEHAEWTLPRANSGAIQGAFNVPGAIQITGAKHSQFRGCSVAHIGQAAIEVGCGSSHHRFLGCRLYDLGGGGIKINSESGIRAADDSSTSITGRGAFRGMSAVPAVWKFPAGQTAPVPGRDPSPGTHVEVADCTIRDGGVIFHSAHGVWIGNSGYNHIHHNEISWFRYSGISVGWTWSFCPTYTVGNRIEYNHIHHIGMGVLSDLGGIYTLGLHPDSVIRGNHIHDITAYGYGGWGIYLDQGSSYFRVEENVCHHTKGGGFHLHYGRDNIVRGNAFLYSAGDEFCLSRSEYLLSLIAENNLIGGGQGRLYAGPWRVPTFRMNHNFYWARCGRVPSFNGLSWAEWQARGYDAKSWIGDPLILGPAGDAPVLRPDSPVVQAGFQMPDVTLAGPRRGPGKREPREPAPSGLEGRFDFEAPDHPNGVDDYMRMLVQPMASIPPGKSTQTVSYVLRNAGKQRVRGEIRFTAQPRTAGSWRGPKRLAYDLAPGEHTEAEFEVRLAPGAKELLLEALSSDTRMLPSLIWVRKDSAPTLRIRRVEPLASLEAVESTLRAERPATIRWGSRSAAEIRLAVAGPDLALLAQVTDVQVEQSRPPWDGSCLEIFCARRNEKVVGQVILQPSTPKAPAQGWRQRGNAMEEPSIRLESHATATGYEMAALIPLSLLTIEPTDNVFRIEVGLTTTLPELATERIRTLLSGALIPPAMPEGYAHVRVEDTR